MENISLSEIVIALTSLLAVAFLIVLLIDYWKRDNGLRNGATLLAFLAVILIIIPNAKSLGFKFAGGELSYETNDDLQKEQLKLTALNQGLEAQQKRMADRLEEIAESIEINGKILDELSLHSVNNKESKAQIQNLVDEQNKITRSLRSEENTYEIQFKELELNQICEKANNTGEFYYSFMIDGRTIVDVNLKDRISARKGDIISLSEYNPVTIRSDASNGQFIASGFVKEYDGRTFLGLGGSIKVTTVGTFSEELSVAKPQHEIYIGNVNNSICRATLRLNVLKLTA